MSMRLYVGNLPYTVTQDQLKDIFAPFGPVITVNLIIDKFSNRSKGFGFVELEDENAQNAISSLNGTEMDGRKIIVNEAKPKEEGGPRRSGGFSGGGFSGGNSRGGGFRSGPRRNVYDNRG